MKKIHWIILILLVAAGAGAYGLYEYNRGPKSLSGVDADMRVDAAELLKMYSENEADANAKYLDKVIVVTGNILEVRESENGQTIVLDAGDMMSGIACEMQTKITDADLELGTPMTIKGQCTGMLLDVVLVKSVIE